MVYFRFIIFRKEEYVFFFKVALSYFDFVYCISDNLFLKFGIISRDFTKKHKCVP